MSGPRKLAAILAADVAGYSRLTGIDEEGTLKRLRKLRRELINPAASLHRGRIVKTTGDGILIEFPSVVDAVRCALDVQREMDSRNSDSPAERRIEFRIGINLGDVVIEGEDLLGDGVNVAARLEGISEPGGICISDAAYHHVRDKLDVNFEDGGEQQLKNIARPVRIYRLRSDRSFAQSKPALPLPDKPSIAVLPFTNMSDDPEQEYFSDGMTEDIITALSRLRWFFVIARNSTFTYKGQGVDVRQVGRELGVRYVLEGSVRKSGERVRITSQLLDAITGNHIWAERYDRDLTDIFALQDEITASVTAAIEPKLLAAEGLRAQARSTDDLDAWDLVARALSHFWKLTAAESQTAIDLLRQAVQTHPDYAPAHSLLAFVILISFNVGRIPTRIEREFAGELAHRAVELDDSDPWAHIAMGYVAFVARKNTKASIRHFHTALDLNPNFATAAGSVDLALMFDGQSDDAILTFERALRMSPRDPFNGIFFAAISAAHYFAGRYLQAVDWARKAVEMRPGNLGGWRILCASLAQAGEIEESKAAMRTVRQLQPDLSIAWIKEWVPYTSGPMTHFLEGMWKAGLTD